MNEKLTIARINGVDVVATIENGTTLVPIKPICEALGIDDKSQRERIQSDDILSSVGVLSTSVGADGKKYEMFCLPIQYVFGWLFLINPKNVAPDAREKVSKYRRESYDVLYSHFTKENAKLKDQNDLERSILSAKRKALEDIENHKTEIARLKESLRKCDESLDKLQNDRINPEPSLFD